MLNWPTPPLPPPFPIPPPLHPRFRICSKLASVFASMFAARYVFHWRDHFGDAPLRHPPAFDGRAIAYPGAPVLRDYLSWRQADCAGDGAGA